MEPLEVRHTYGQKVNIDICTRCHLVFFDKHEHRVSVLTQCWALSIALKQTPSAKAARIATYRSAHAAVATKSHP